MILIISPKNAYITSRLLEEAGKAGVAVEAMDIQTLADRHFKVDLAKYACLYVRFCYPYFEQIIELARQFIGSGKKVVDAAIADGDLGLGKMQLYGKMAAAGIPIPMTEWLAEAKGWRYPGIVKWKYGFGGKEVFLVRNAADLRRATDLIPQEELLLQEFIDADYEYKVITVGYKALPVVLRFGIDNKTWRPDFSKAEAINIGHTGAAEGRALQRMVELAEQSAFILKRELAKVDILRKGDKFYVLEANRWPGLKSFEQLTGYNAAREFLRYLRN